LDFAIPWVTSPYTWVIAFIVFSVIELSTGGVFSLLCGLGALVTALFLYSGLITEAGYAVFTFLLSTVILTIVLWKPLQRMMIGLKSDPADPDIEPFVGDMATVDEAPLTREGGHIRLHGSRMNAVLANDAGVQSLDPGTQVTVRAVDNQQRFIVVPIAASTSLGE
jgi:membrane protein implicated in regulation of membrane protease activity